MKWPISDDRAREFGCACQCVFVVASELIMVMSCFQGAATTAPGFARLYLVAFRKLPLSSGFFFESSCLCLKTTSMGFRGAIVLL
jgi:hypothetical protein